MIDFPHAKLNLGLYIVSKRPDGFHDLQTFFYPLPLYDILEVVPAAKTSLVTTGLEIPDRNTNNLVLRAHQFLKEKFSQVEPLEIHLHKSIPAGAGLGGGSSDAAKMLQLVNNFFNLNMAAEKLAAFALELGSDCPFFMQNEPCFATGRGEILEPTALDLSSFSFLLIHPGIHINTSLAFSVISPAPPDHNLKQSLLLPVTEWKERIKNVFEIPAFKAHPVLKQIKEKLYAEGALFASMTGSGSTVYGIFPKGRLPKRKLGLGLETSLP
jgi:4-diphosphocytidyl-2-C-methyl-D-erythritol kinase